MRRLVVLIALAAIASRPQPSRADPPKPWQNPLQKTGYLGSPLVETTPFVFRGRLYLLENNQAFFDDPKLKLGEHFEKDELRIRDVETGKLISVALKNHGFGTAFVWHDKVYVFAASWARASLGGTPPKSR